VLSALSWNLNIPILASACGFVTKDPEWIPNEASSRTIVLPGVSPFVGNPGIAALTKPLPFKKLCLDAGLPLSYMNLIETSAVAMRLNPKAW
jgi:hypothetical protein